ncbi:MAG: GNAT family N-acetyltransferase [Acetatifactor sp.]|nr:GNAT family N-acetyltransferase [Acetatifactor sp.]
MEITVRRIEKDREADIRLPNEPFSIYGRMIPHYDGENWSFDTVRLPQEQVHDMVFPDENYDYDAMAENSIFMGAYEGEQCVGLAIYQHNWNKYLYLYDLKVNAACRGRRIGEKLIAAGRELARENGYRGLYTVGQDNNLRACSFYIRCGFEIGGLDTRVYQGTSQEGKRDILFYLENDGSVSKTGKDKN